MGASAVSTKTCITLFVMTCLLIFSLVYMVLLAQVGQHDNHKVSMAISNLNSDRSLRNDLNLQALTNPFSICPAYHYETQEQGVGVVILVHNKHANVIIQTVKSILANSGGIVPQIMIVDDHSSFPVKQWPEWKTIRSSKPVKVITLEERKGYAYSKSVACKQLKNLGNIDVVVFLEGGSIVNTDWLTPLLHTLRQHPSSLVYPAIDIFDDTEDFFYQSGNMVATFDWSLRLAWEDLDALKDDTNTGAASDSANSLQLRFPLIYQQPHSATDTIYSPAVPPTFAVRLEFLQSIGDFSTSPMFSVFGADNIELSLRAWLCANGGIIRQPCSRVALRRKIQQNAPTREHTHTEHAKYVLVDVFEGIGSETGMHVDDEYTQFDADQDALTTAEMWMGGEPYSQFVLNSRLSGGRGSSSRGSSSKGSAGRFPYPVKQMLDARHSHYLSHAKDFGQVFDRNECKRFAWYLHAVYPGLMLDLPISEMHHMDNVQDHHLAALLTPLTKQYKRVSSHSSGAAVTGHFTPKVATYHLPTAADIAAEEKEKEMQELAYRVRDELLCMDVDTERCTRELSNKGCEANLGYTMFHCPKTCGFCSGESDKEELCIDFYLNKCPKMAAEGKCTDASNAGWMEENCRQSCQICV